MKNTPAHHTQVIPTFTPVPSSTQRAGRWIPIVLLIIVGMVPRSTFAQEKIDVEKDPRYTGMTWVQNSAEYALLTEQTYRMALSQLYVGIEDAKWSADEVQVIEGGFESKLPAVILDCDETVLDNSAYNARNIIRNELYTTDSWNAWCLEEKADAIPGAHEFVKRAEALGVKVFYITNRRDVVKQATINNLKALGFDADDSTVLTKNPEQDRGDDKVTRRASVAKNYRIVLLIGDSMSDLCTGMDVPNTNRRNEIASEKTQLLGSRWVMMPNPVYGGWQRALPEAEKALHSKLDPETK
ncbi:MAG: 5'-nucleotidase (lipoprotein e(P4) family) [Mariniblastus sp.]|jgi:5'-nucleotidase (lipoprotein e(P4) family)